jgi:ABC-type phosphate/phosphonate transport system substrate-binding protein
LATLVVLPAFVALGEAARVDVLRIGSSGTLSTGKGNDKGALKTMRRFIQDETGLRNEIVDQKSWRDLADKMAKGQLQIGAFQGYEFAWAQAQYPKLRPLVTAVNVYPYPVAYVVAQRDNPARDFAGLRGQALALTRTNKGFLRLYIDGQCRALGKKAEGFFSKIVTKDNFEDAIDDVVDGVEQAAVCDRATLEAYKQQKPGRFNRLKAVAHSQPFPPGVIAAYDSALDQATLSRFRRGLLNASKKEQGRMMLTLFRLTGFGNVPDDFEHVLARTRKAYPPPESK